MKKIENTFTVTGFVGKDAEIRQFANTSVARFSMAVSRQEKNGDDSNRISAFINVEAWRKNEKTDSFENVARKFSIDPRSANNGGNLGYIPEGSTMKEFNDQLKKLKKVYSICR